MRSLFPPCSYVSRYKPKLISFTPVRILGLPFAPIIAKIKRTCNIIQRNNEARSCNHCCSGEAISSGHAQCTDKTSCKRGTVGGTARRPHFPHVIISATLEF
jgi:hypothetical protein